jgi:hypothetical protein
MSKDSRVRSSVNLPRVSLFCIFKRFADETHDLQIIGPPRDDDITPPVESPPRRMSRST